MKIITLFVPLLLVFGCSSMNQIHDSGFIPIIEKPAFLKEAGPAVFIDEGHNNFHTMNGRYKPFADVLRKDGYKVFPHKGSFTKKSLKHVNILVISNALHISNLKSWSLPTPSAFSDEEIIILNEWVKSGGALWLIADHMPIPGAAEKLALSFGFKLMNGFAYIPGNKSHIRYSRDNGTLMDHIITRGLNKNEVIQSVYTYTGHAFKIPHGAEPILVFKKGSYSLNPKHAFKFDKDTAKFDITSWSQGAVKKYGKGRIAMFGEAAAFTAQIAGKKRKKIGMNSSDAPYNLQFILNIMHWLTGILNNNQSRHSNTLKSDAANISGAP